MKTKFIISVSISLIILLGLYTYFHYDEYKLIRLMKEKGYTLTYIKEPSLKEYRRMERIISDTGEFVEKTYYYDETTELEGSYSKLDMDNFVKYAIKHGIYQMTDDMDDRGVYDGSNIYFALTIGSKKVIAGGYMAYLIDKDFKKIMLYFDRLENELDIE